MSTLDKAEGTRNQGLETHVVLLSPVNPEGDQRLTQTQHFLQLRCKEIDVQVQEKDGLSGSKHQGSGLNWRKVWGPWVSSKDLKSCASCMCDHKDILESCPRALCLDFIYWVIWERVLVLRNTLKYLGGSGYHVSSLLLDGSEEIVCWCVCVYTYKA